jgi:hypothetical protein
MSEAEYYVKASCLNAKDDRIAELEKERDKLTSDAGKRIIKLEHELEQVRALLEAACGMVGIFALTRDEAIDRMARSLVEIVPEKTPGQVLCELIHPNAKWEDFGPISQEKFHTHAAAVIAHHEAAK